MATLVVPLITMTPADAATQTDLSITKTVASMNPPVAFSPTLRDVRANGSDNWTRDGLHIKTLDWTSEDKVGEYVASSTPLADAGAEPSIEYSTISGSIPPGFVLKVDMDGNGSIDGELVGEDAYHGDWWLNFTRDMTPSAAFKKKAPSCDGSDDVGTLDEDTLINTGKCTGGSGSAWHGTLNQWRASLGSVAIVRGWGFSLGAGVQGEYLVTGLTFAGTHHDLVRRHQSSIKAAPGESVEYQIRVANGATGADASGVTVNDVLPADLTPDPSSLEFTGPDWCDFSGNTLSCTGGTLPAGSSAKIWFRATISDDVSSAGLGSTIGHHVDVQKQEVFADLTAGQTKTFSVLCPSGYVPTDGGLLVDAVDQGGFYSDIVVAKSKPTVVGGVQGWLVTASNLGDQRGQGKVKVTCLDGTIGSANGHTHDVVVAASTGAASILASSTDADGEPVTVSCPAGYTPVAPQHTVTSGIAVIRSSYADGADWKWIVDHEPGTAATFNAQCLAPETTATGGHTATLPITTSSYTVSADPDGRTEGVVQCGPSKNGIVGGYDGEDAALLSLGRESRGNNYMFRFWNDDWDHTYDADLSVTCVGVRTADEPVYYHVRNTATISTAPAQPDLSTADNSSTADITIVGDAVQPAGGVVVEPSGDRVRSGGFTRKVTLGVTCTSACAFTVKVLKDGTVVAKATKSLSASPDPRFVNVPTTSAGKNLAHNDVVVVKVKTSTGTTSTTVTLL